MENQIKNFFDYLFYIGVTSDETSSLIIKLLTSKYNDYKIESNSIDDLIIAILCDYFKLLKEKQLELIGKNIYEQYIKNKYVTKLKLLKKVIKIKYYLLNRKIKIYFHKWILKTINLSVFNGKENNKTMNINNNNDKTISFSDSSLNDHFLNKLNYYSEKKKKKLEKLRDLNDSNFVNIYTFSPNISHYKKKNEKKRLLSENKELTEVIEMKRNKYENIYKFLYDEYKYKKVAKENLAKKLFDERGFTFSPKINKNSKYINNIKDTFFERNEKIIKNKKQCFEEIIKKKNNKKSPIFSHKSLKKSFSSKNI